MDGTFELAETAANVAYDAAVATAKSDWNFDEDFAYAIYEADYTQASDDYDDDVALADSNYMTAGNGAVAAWWSLEESAWNLYQAADTFAYVVYVLAEGGLWSTHEFDVAQANLTYNTDEAGAWNTYVGKESVAWTDYENTESNAWSDYEGIYALEESILDWAVNNAWDTYETNTAAALIVWQGSEQSAWNTYVFEAAAAHADLDAARGLIGFTLDSQIAAAVAAWDASEAAAWGIVLGIESGARNTWDSGAAIARSAFVSSASAALSAWNGTQSGAQSLFSSELTGAEGDWHSTESAAWAVYQQAVANAPPGIAQPEVVLDGGQLIAPIAATVVAQLDPVATHPAPAHVVTIGVNSAGNGNGGQTSNFQGGGGGSQLAGPVGGYSNTYLAGIGGFFGGLGTGLKAITNQSVKSAGAVVSLGYWDVPNVIAVNERDLGYDQSAFAARVGVEAATAAVTLGASTVTKAGTVVKVARTVNAVDTAGNIVQGGQGALDTYKNGPSYANTAKIITGGIGLAQVAKAATGAGKVVKEAPAPAKQTGQCFPAGTLISTAEGLRTIEMIRPGDQVWAFDLGDGKWKLKSVLKNFERDYKFDSIFVTVDSDTIESTQLHPYWVISGENLDERPRLVHLPKSPPNTRLPGRWVDAQDLCVDDMMYLRDGREVPIEVVRREPADQIVYNFSVEDLECYAVGASGVLVHNTNGSEAVVDLSKLPKKVAGQITKNNLPVGGKTPFKPKLVKNKAGEMEIAKVEITTGPMAGKKGYVDQNGNIWIKDSAHAGYPEHWDVQVNGGTTYNRVGLDGNDVVKII